MIRKRWIFLFIVFSLFFLKSLLFSDQAKHTLYFKVSFQTTLSLRDQYAFLMISKKYYSNFTLYERTQALYEHQIMLDISAFQENAFISILKPPINRLGIENFFVDAPYMENVRVYLTKISFFY